MKSRGIFAVLAAQIAGLVANARHTLRRPGALNRGTSPHAERNAYTPPSHITPPRAFGNAGHKLTRRMMRGRKGREVVPSRPGRSPGA
jgi:hypothetical protein